MLQPGRRLGDRYRLDARIGAGGMGEVWRATDEVLGRVVAVKVMLPGVADDPGLARRFLTEAKAMAGVNHPAVTAIHDYGSSGGTPYLVMEFVDGESLAQLLGRHGRLTAAQTMQLVARAADGLRAVHERGIVHRDIKPANLLVRRDGSVLITDFGIARLADATPLTTAGAILGTPTYLAPEQVLGRPASALTDVYSLGLTAYECLAGHRPFTGDNPYAVALQRIQSAPRTLAGDLPVAVLAVVERALAPEPGDRWPSAADLAAAARAAAATLADPDQDRAPAGPGRPGAMPDLGHAPLAGPADHGAKQPDRGRMRRGRRAVLLTTAAVVVTLVGFLGFLGWKAMGDDRHEADPGGRPASGPGAAAPKGFGECDAGLCPAAPLCWGGMVAISGRAMPPGAADCAGDHYWETFAAVPLPSDASGVRQDKLIGRPDVAAACSAAVMARRSEHPAATTGWRRDAWPVQTGDTWLLHCIAGSDSGETKGAVFR
ncbi:serine/threonine-protein kinase [Actinoplanes sp. NPDC051475]|uniref:serine/threonine-protein kinase n=1 Tax=Actinoplanes sp. NPDC051475 TaxID=3157225 RepID=UPI003450DAEC